MANPKTFFRFKTFVHFSIFLVFLTLAGCQSAEKPIDNQTGADTETAQAPEQEFVSTQTEESPDLKLKVREGVETLFRHVRSGDQKALAAMMLYRGKDESRHAKSSLNLKDPGEKYTVESSAEVIKLWLGVNNEYTFGVLDVINDQEGRDVFIQEVVFVTDKGLEKKRFAFLEMNDQLFLVNFGS